VGNASNTGKTAIPYLVSGTIIGDRELVDQPSLSRNFLRTTWVPVMIGGTDYSDDTAERLLDLLTDWPMNYEFQGMSGDYHTWLLAQQGGRKAIADYIRTRSENAPNADRDAVTRRYAVYQEVRRRARACRPRRGRLNNDVPVKSPTEG
jgi:hypothetical protein